VAFLEIHNTSIWSRNLTQTTWQQLGRAEGDFFSAKSCGDFS